MLCKNIYNLQVFLDMWQRAICPNKSSRSTSDWSIRWRLTLLCVCQTRRRENTNIPELGMMLGDVEGHWPDKCWLATETTSYVQSFLIADTTVFTAVLRVTKRFSLDRQMRWCVFGVRGQNVQLLNIIALLVLWWGGTQFNQVNTVCAPNTSTVI